MTGFGDVSEQVQGTHYSVEIRSLNNRYFKATIRLPDEIAGLESELETLIRHRLSRGSVTLTIRIRRPDSSAAHKVNDVALMEYLEHLETIHKKIAAEDKAVNIDLTALLAMPGVLQPRDEVSNTESARPVIFRLVEEACRRLMTMRITEGKTILADLNKQKTVIHERLALVIERAPKVVEDYHTRLRTRIDELLARADLKVDDKDVIREVAIFAERVDVSEETTRLRGHLDQFDKILSENGGEPAGRTLDFLSQELLREANTISSKSNDVLISRAIVDVKGSIDRIKEQVQNVE